MSDVGLQIEGESGAAQAKRRAGDEQKDCLHGQHGGAAELDGQLSARPVKITTGNNKLSDHFLCYGNQNALHSAFTTHFIVQSPIFRL